MTGFLVYCIIQPIYVIIALIAGIELTKLKANESFGGQATLEVFICIINIVIPVINVILIMRYRRDIDSVDSRMIFVKVCNFMLLQVVASLALDIIIEVTFDLEWHDIFRSGLLVAVPTRLVLWWRASAIHFVEEKKTGARY